MFYATRFLQLTIFLVCLISITSCSKLTSDKRVNSGQPIDSPYTMPSDAYLALANNQEGEEKQSLQLLAAGQLIYEGQWKQSASMLSQIKPLNYDLAKEKYLLQARIDLIREQPKAAISKLSNVRNIASLPVYYQIQFHEMLASAYFITNHPVESVHERIKLENILPNDSSKTNNRLALWRALTTLSGPEVSVLAAESSDDNQLNGWIELANISQNHSNDPQIMLTNIQNWQSKYPQHPGNYILPKSQSQIVNYLFSQPKKIALLLPTTGQLSGPGNAIKDGFMDSLEASPNRYSINVQVYNTTSENIKNLYQQAINDGANYVVGPLSKPQVTEVAKLSHPVPTLLLNDSEVKPQANAYQFGLSPTNEARQIANKIHKKGNSRALVIAPDGTWGKDIVDAFARQFRAGGGQVVETFYFNNDDDLTTSIRELLHVAANDAHRKKVEKKDDEPEEPLRREDFDVIFLVAYPTKARQIVPLLRYYYAGDIPVYATSNVYTGSINVMKDRDLNNVIFCDMPWVFTHQVGNQNWPEQFNSYNRLYAMGMDAFALATQLNQLLLFPAVGINNKSGIIYLNGGQEISRILVFGKFQEGEAKIRPYL
ncbi:MAG: penicillin-binding protein activator [Legionellaceae bacterium]|nr:penicillin-binding protein activator [Legionellaceae bacterium]